MKSVPRSPVSAAPERGAGQERESPSAVAGPAGLGYPVPMKRQSRLEAVLSAVIMANSTTIKDLTRKFGLSEMTIRRDIEALEKAGLLRSYRGGVIVAERHARAARAPSYSLATAEAEHVSEKRAIARAGRPAYRARRRDLPGLGVHHRLHPRPRRPAARADHLLLQPQHLQPRGGPQEHPRRLRRRSLPPGFSVLRQPRGARAAQQEQERQGVHLGERAAHRPRRHHAGPVRRPHQARRDGEQRCSFLVADSSKCGLVRTGHFANLDDFDAVISDDGFPADMRAFLAERDVELLLASAAAETDESSS